MVAAAVAGLGGRGLFDFPSTTRAISKSATARGSAASPLPAPPSSSSSSSSSTVPFLLADIGEGISEVELLQWFVSPGDSISQFDRVCEVQSDKASVEITSRYDGVVMSLCGNVGDVMLVGRPLLHILSAGTSTSMSSGAIPPPTTTTTGATLETTTLNNVDDERDRLRIPSVGANYSSYYGNNTEGGGGGGGGERSSFTPRGAGGGPTMANDATNGGGSAKVLTSPAVRKLGRENNIDLGTVMGTGPGGRVLKADVLGIINPVPSSSSPMSPSPMSPPRTTTNAATAKREEGASGAAGGTAVVPIRGYHRLMVKTMTSSLQVPHMVYCDEVNVDALTAVRDSLRPLYAARQDAIGDPNRGKLTYMPFFVKAASLALTSYPVLNSTIDVGEMTLAYHDEHRIGIAVDTPRGLAVPVVGDCRDRSVLEIADELNRLYSLVSDREEEETLEISKVYLSLSLSIFLSLCLVSR